MPKSIISGIAILLLFLPFFSPCSAMAFTVQEGAAAVQKSAPSKTPSNTTPANTSSQPRANTSSQAPAKASSQSQAKASSPSAQSAQREVVNIFVDRIEDGAIYSKDGRKFEIGSVKVIDNSRPATKMKAAELSFVNGSLTAVILK
jgi:hypothetical protein